MVDEDTDGRRVGGEDRKKMMGVGGWTLERGANATHLFLFTREIVSSPRSAAHGSPPPALEDVLLRLAHLLELHVLFVESRDVLHNVIKDARRCDRFSTPESDH